MFWRRFWFCNDSPTSIFTFSDFFFQQLFKCLWFFDNRNIIYTERIYTWSIRLITLIRVILTILACFIIISIMNSTVSCLALIINRILRLIKLTIKLIIVWFNIVGSYNFWISLIIWTSISFTANNFFEICAELIVIIIIHFNFLNVTFLLLLLI